MNTYNPRGGDMRWLAWTALALAGCTMVDQTEVCVQTRYGRVIKERMATGLDFSPFARETCFSITDQNFPGGPDGKETMEAQTGDPVTITGDVSVVFAYDSGTLFNEVFLEKRTPAAAETEIFNAVREGYRSALASWTVAEIFTERRAALADSVRAHIQRKIGNRAIIRMVFVRDIKIPPAIEEARITAARQAQVFAAAKQQYDIDSVNAKAKIISAEADARAQRLLADAYAANPAVLQLEIARAQAAGLKEACRGVQTCVIGGTLMDLWGKR